MIAHLNASLSIPPKMAEIFAKISVNEDVFWWDVSDWTKRAAGRNHRQIVCKEEILNT